MLIIHASTLLLLLSFFPQLLPKQTRSTPLLTDQVTTTATEEKGGRESKKNDSIPAVPEFSMPQSSAAGSIDSTPTAPAQNGRFKIVFKGVVDQVSLISGSF